MGKHLDALPAKSDFRAPWQTESGEDAELNPKQLRDYLYNLRVDKAKAQDAADEQAAKVTELEAANATLTQERDAASPDEANRKIARLESQVAALTTERDGLVEANAQRELRAEVLGDFATEHPKAAKYVTGTTKEELEASLADVREDFGITEGEGEEDNPLDSQPKSRLRTGSQRNGDPEDTGAFDADKIAAEIMGGGPLV